MSPAASLLLIAGLILASAFFSISEISIASARRMRLRQIADDGDVRATRVLELQQQPGRYITLVQIGLNAVTILGGIVGEGVLSPVYTRLLERVVEPELARTLGFLISFSTVTALFLLFADLFPKRVGIVRPEQVAMRIVGPLNWLIALLAPLVWVFERMADGLFKLFGLPQTRDDRVTHHDILAMAEAGTAAGTWTSMSSR